MNIINQSYPDTSRPAKLYRDLPARRVLRGSLLACGGLFALGALFANTARAQTAPVCPKDKAIISCNMTPQVDADMQELQVLVREQFAAIGSEGFSPADIKIRFIGQARSSNLTRADDSDDVVSTGNPSNPGTSEQLRSTTWRLFKPFTGNEFEMEVPETLRSAFHTSMVQDGKTMPTRGRFGATGGDSPDRPIPQRAAATSGYVSDAWSGGNDSRVRRTDTTSFPWRTITDLGGCTATLVGPRHIVTAGHCIYNQSKSSWASAFNVVPGRDANNLPFGFSAFPGDGSQAAWLFTPVGWRAKNPAGGSGQYDLGIVVIPDRLGDQVGAMGYGTLSANEMRNGARHLLRGYPYCESETDPDGNGSGERIDEPVVCTVNGFYVGEPCSADAFSATGGDGYSRRVTHGCDASAANSGSSVYTYVDFPNVGSVPFVTMIHTTSTKCRAPGDAPCTAADLYPLVATRLTPEYSGWISYFRSLFP